MEQLTKPRVPKRALGQAAPKAKGIEIPDISKVVEAIKEARQEAPRRQPVGVQYFKFWDGPGHRIPEPEVEEFCIECGVAGCYLGPTGRRYKGDA